MNRLHATPEPAEDSGDQMAALQTRVQLLELQLREKQQECADAHAQARALQESAGSGIQAPVHLASLEQMLDASNERSRLQEKQAEVLQAEVDRLRSEMQACTRDSAHAIARANADRDLALARALPLESTVQLMRSQMRVLVDQLGAASALAADVLGESVEQAHRILGADQDCRDLARRIADLEREKDELHDTVRRLHHDRDLAERKADLLAFELRSAKKEGSVACPAGRSARQHAVPADGKDGDQEATERSPRQGSVQQTDIDRTFPLNKVDELVRMLADANAASKNSELKCQNLTSKQANAELQLEAALLQLSSLQEQKEQMQRLHSSKMELIVTLATRLFEQVSELDDAIGVSLYQLLLSSGALEMEGGALQTRAPTAPAVDVRSPHLSQFFQGVHSGGKGMRMQARTHLELSNYSSQSPGSLSQLKDTSASSPRGEGMLVGASGPPPAHSEMSTWPAQEPTRGMLVYLNLQMRDVAEQPQFETELLEEVALAANVRADELKVLRVEASFGNQHVTAHSVLRPEENHSVSHVVVEIHVPDDVTLREGNWWRGERTRPGVYVVRSLMEQVHEMQSILRMGLHSRNIFRIVPVRGHLFPHHVSDGKREGEGGGVRMESSRSATQQAGSPRQRVWSSPPAAYNPTAASTHSSPLQTSPSMVVGGTESNVIGLVKEELLAEVTKVREWAKDEVAKERRINLRLRQQLQQDFELKQHLQQRLEQVQAECRAEQRERMRFAATYVNKVAVHVFEIDRIEQEMSAQVLKTEQLLSQISTQTRAAYTSLCALCVRSRLEIEEHKQKAHESSKLANKYRDTLKMLEKDRNSTRAGSIKNASARMEIAQVVARGVQELKVEIHQIAKELELIHRDEAALQSISEFLQQRLLQSSEDLDTTERELDRSVEEASELRGRCNEQTVAMADLHRVMVEGICRASHQRRCRFTRASAWNQWVSSVRSKVQWNILLHLAANPRGRLHHTRMFASGIMQKWHFVAQQNKQRKIFGTFLWGFAERRFTTRVCTRVMRVWLTALMDGWRFRVCSYAHARLHRRRVWYHSFRRWRKEAGALPTPLPHTPAPGVSIRGHDVILDPARKPATLKWQRLCIGVMLRWVRDQAVDGFLSKIECSPTRVKSPHSRFSALSNGPHSNGPQRPRFLPPRDLGLMPSPRLLTKAGGSAAKSLRAGGSVSFGQEMQGLRSAALRFSDSD